MGLPCLPAGRESKRYRTYAKLNLFGKPHETAKAKLEPPFILPISKKDFLHAFCVGKAADT